MMNTPMIQDSRRVDKYRVFLDIHGRRFDRRGEVFDKGKPKFDKDRVSREILSVLPAQGPSQGITMADGSIELHVEQIDDVTCITLVDMEISIASVQSIQDEIIGHLKFKDAPKLIVDFSPVMYLPTPALGAMVNIHTQAIKHGGQLCLVGLNSVLTELFQVSKLDQLFSIHDDVDSAMTSMGS